MTESDSAERTLPWRITAALIVVCLLALGGWVFAQHEPTAARAGASATVRAR